MSDNNYIKPKFYTGKKKLKGQWQVTSKIDGVRAFIDLVSYNVTSRKGKPLYNFPTELLDELSLICDEDTVDCEVFRNSWNESIALVRNQSTGYTVTMKDLYILTDDNMDRRLHREWLEDPTPEQIQSRLEDARREGLEGLVLRQGDIWYKVKPFETYDVVVTDAYEGEGKNVGCLGAFQTEMGKVGSGFFEKEWSTLTKKQLADVVALGYNEESYTKCTRRYIWEHINEYSSAMIEVKCMELTEDGKFRHPSFVRLREDK